MEGSKITFIFIDEISHMDTKCILIAASGASLSLAIHRLSIATGKSLESIEIDLEKIKDSNNISFSIEDLRKIEDIEIPYIKIEEIYNYYPEIEHQEKLILIFISKCRANFAPFRLPRSDLTIKS